jgi:hypothetical protein
VSAVLFVATVVLWVRSHRTADMFAHNHWPRYEVIDSRRGQLSVLVFALNLPPDEFPPERYADDGFRYYPAHPGYAGVADNLYRLNYASTRYHWHGLGFRLFASDGAVAGNPAIREPKGYDVAAPHWAVAVASAVMPVRFGVRLWRTRQVRRRRAAGRCLHCGYDLRATPREGGALLSRCPECGAPAKGAA